MMTFAIPKSLADFFHRQQGRILRITLHVLYWITVLLFYVFYFGHWEGNYTRTLFFVLALMPVTIGTCYFVLYFLLPRYVFQAKSRSIPLLIYLGLYTLVLYTYLNTLIVTFFLFHQLFNMDNSNSSLDFSTTDISIVVLSMMFAIMLAVAIKLFKYWFREQDRSQRLVREKIETELKMLKMQLNPHFLFNTLNSIYALALTKSNDTPEVVLKLSGMLDYILYECKADKVALHKEVRFLENYIALEKLRFGDRADVQFTSRLHSPEIMVPPMLLLPFVENSFKHGAAGMRTKCSIKIDIKTTPTELHLQVVNDLAEKPRESSPSSGIGLESVKKQLDLLYPGNYQLDIERGNGRFSVNLKIPVET